MDEFVPARQDHENARSLAEGQAETVGIDCDLSRVETNIVYFRLKTISAASFLTACSGQGLLGGASGSDRVRFVTHYGAAVRHAPPGTSTG